MGYDIRFYVVDKYEHSINKENNKCFAEIIAKYEYCKDCNLCNFCDTFEDTDCYVYDNFEETILKDCYGDNLKEIPINDMINYLEKNSSFDYCRYRPFLYMLRGFKEEYNNYRNIVILKYGH